MTPKEVNNGSHSHGGSDMMTTFWAFNLKQKSSLAFRDTEHLKANEIVVFGPADDQLFSVEGFEKNIFIPYRHCCRKLLYENLLSGHSESSNETSKREAIFK
jgi:hypothetical protein